MNKLFYGKHYIDKKDINFVKDSLNAKIITGGKYLNKFESKIKSFTNSKFALACNSGTSGIHLALLAMNIKAGDNVLMPTINFVASYNMCKIIGANPIFIDVDPLTGQLQPAYVEKFIKNNQNIKIKLLVTMYLGGYPENILQFYKLKKKYNFLILEDSCHAFGANYLASGKKYMIGSCKHSDISTFSFHPVKSITTGEGGAITTNNKKYFDKMSLLRSHGIIRKKNYWQYDIKNSGYNYRISDINCALGITQIKKTDFFLKERKKIYDYYFVLFKDLFPNIISFPKYCAKNKPSFHLFLININFTRLKISKNKFIKYLNIKNIYPQFHYIPLYKFSCVKTKLKFANSEVYFDNTLSIPIYVGLTEKEQIYIFKNLIRIIKNNIKSKVNKK